MKKKVIIISLGGSLIIPEKVDIQFLERFRKIILKNTKEYKFIIVCGGGKTARVYIEGLKNYSNDIQSSAGIFATRMNAKFVSCFFKQNPPQEIPMKIRKIKKLLKRQDIVICGALEFKPKQTTDSNAAEIATYFKTEFINLTNVSGLYDKNPKEHKNARLIKNISWERFDKIANKIKFHPGQHFILDQTASKIILENKIPTYILGKNMKELNNLLKGQKFKGTIIQG